MRSAIKNLQPYKKKGKISSLSKVAAARHKTKQNNSFFLSCVFRETEKSLGRKGGGGNWLVLHAGRLRTWAAAAATATSVSIFRYYVHMLSFRPLCWVFLSTVKNYLDRPGSKRAMDTGNILIFCLQKGHCLSLIHI